MANDIDDLANAVEPLADALRDLEGLAGGFGRAMTTAFRQAVVDGRRLEDVLRSLALGLAGRALSAALAPIGQGIGGIIGGFFGAGGGGAQSLSGAASMRGEIGQLSQIGMRGSAPAGADAATSGARRTAGAAGISVTFNVTSPDAQSFRRAEAELTAMLARTVARGQRGL